MIFCVGLNDNCADFSLTWILVAAVTQPVSLSPLIKKKKKIDEPQWGVVNRDGVSILQDEKSSVDGWLHNNVNAIHDTELTLQNG